MEELARGAEAVIFKDKEIVIKKRIKKSYRHEIIDKNLRKYRTRTEEKLIREAKRAGINVPDIKESDEKESVISMDLIDGKKLKDILESLEKSLYLKVCAEIGASISRLHENSIIHGDLTTSNMILKNEKVYFIDFGLGFFSDKTEDKAVDMYLLKQSLNSGHPKIFEKTFALILKSYKNTEVIRRISTIEKRHRYNEKT